MIIRVIEIVIVVVIVYMYLFRTKEVECNVTQLPIKLVEEYFLFSFRNQRQKIYGYRDRNIRCYRIHSWNVSFTSLIKIRYRFFIGTLSPPRNLYIFFLCFSIFFIFVSFPPNSYESSTGCTYVCIPTCIYVYDYVRTYVRS